MKRKVLFHLLTKEEGGRRFGIQSGYRPELNIGDNKLKSFSTYWKSKSYKANQIRLGQTKEIEIQFFEENWEPELYKTYLVQEGGHIVGNLTFIMTDEEIRELEELEKKVKEFLEKAELDTTSIVDKIEEVA